MLSKETFLRGMKTISTTWEEFKLEGARAEIFYSFFQKYTDNEFLHMIKLYIENSEWAPKSPRSLTKYYEVALRINFVDKQYTPDEAWQLVREALRKYSLHWEHKQHDKFLEYLTVRSVLTRDVAKNFMAELATLSADDSFIGNAFRKAYQQALTSKVDKQIKKHLQLTSPDSPLLAYSGDGVSEED